jgi:glycosyltransferase
MDLRRDRDELSKRRPARLLFVAGGSPATVFALAPLATEARNAGHEVIVAATAEMMPVVVAAGLPGLSVTERRMHDLMFTGRSGQALTVPADPRQRLRFGGRGFGRLAEASRQALSDLAGAWRPDVVLGGTLAFAAGLLADRLGVPYVRHGWDMGEPAEMDAGAVEEIGALPDPALWVHICPPSVLAPEAPPGVAMRFVPTGAQRELQSWMYGVPERPRICLTAGSRANKEQDLGFLDVLLERLTDLDAELVVAAPDDVARELTTRHPRVRAGWLPLGIVLPTCELLVHAGGGQTALTAIHAGVPQLMLPNMPKLIPHCERLTRFGAAETLLPGSDTPDAILAASAKILADDAYAERSRELAAEMRKLPGPAQVLTVIEDLITG